MNMRNDKKSAQDTVFHILKTGIMSLRLPPGTVMSTSEVAARLNVSRTPVREAFIRLQEEGLVDIIPQRETVVSRIDMNRLMQERFIRRSLELAVTEPFIGRCRPRDVVRMRDLIGQQKTLAEEKKYVEFTDLDDRFHQLFFSVAGQELAWYTLNTVNGHDRRFRVLVVMEEGILDSVIRQHGRLADRAEQGDLQGFTQELENHLLKVNDEKEYLLDKYPDYFKTEPPADSTDGQDLYESLVRS